MGNEQFDVRATDQDRDQFLASAKERAREYVDGSQPHLALASLISDFSQHPDLVSHLDFVQELGTLLALNGDLDTPAALRKFIDDFV